MNIVIVDLESTGLRPGHILEIALVVVNQDFEELESFESVVRPANPDWADEMDEFVFNMHTSNGLVELVKNAPTTKVVEEMIVGILGKYDKNETHLAGSSLPALDLPFLRAGMPEVLRAVHYRSIDVTAIRLFAKACLGVDPEYKKAKGHRAMADAYETLDEMRFLKQELFGDRVPVQD